MKSVGKCIKCKCEVWLPDELYNAAQHARSKLTFYCGYGHSMVFLEGETDLDRMRRERDVALKQVARAEQERDQMQRAADRAAKEAKRLKKRTAAGSCPCCKRTFANMAEHMKHQHPEFVSETGAKVVPIKRSVS